MSLGPDGSRPLAWVLERTWATVIVAVVASAVMTAALSWTLGGGPPWRRRLDDLDGRGPAALVLLDLDRFDEVRQSWRANGAVRTIAYRP